MKKLIILLILSSRLAFGQDEASIKVDKILRSELPVRSKIDSLNFISKTNLYKNYQFHDSLAQIALNMSIKEHYKLGAAQSYINLSDINEGLGKLSAAEDNIKKAIGILKEVSPLNKAMLADANLSLGHIFRRTGHKKEAVESLLTAMKLANEAGDLNLVSNCYRGLGIIQVLEKKYDQALNYYNQAIAINKKMGNKGGMSSNYTNIGIVYLRLKQYDKSLAAHQTSLKLAIELKDESRIAFVYNDIGATSLYKGDLKNAILYLKKSIATREQLKEQNEIAYTYNYLGETYNKLKNFAEAEKWIQKALATAISIGNNKQHYEALESLSDFYANNKKYENAYKYLSLYKHYRDSIGEIEGKAAMDELIVKFETEKKEQQIKSLSQQNTIQTLKIKQRNLGLLFAVLIIVSLALLAYFILNRRKLKAKAELQTEIIKQQDIASKAVLDAEERERRRIAGDLHDGVGQMLSAALMNLNGLFSKLIFQQETSLQAEKALALVNESYDEMRSISHQMMPNALIKSGLASAVKEFIGKLDKDKLKISLETIGLNERLEEQTETVIYRVIQETVNNVVKHAEASKLAIQIIKDEEGISVTIEDNGKGFDKNKANLKSGIGLSNIYSRVEFLKGTVDIDSTEGKGTLVAIHIP